MSDNVINTVARRFMIDPGDITGPRRSTYLVNARALAALIMRQRYGMSYPEIGGYLNRDHTSVIYLCRKAERLIKESPARATFVASQSWPGRNPP